MISCRSLASAPVLALAAAFALAGAPARTAAEPATGAPVDGIRCDLAEGSVFHIHQHVSLFARGRAIAIPSDVGRPLSGCLYWLHTHTPDGLVHVEAPAFRTFTLGNFFDVWGQPLSRTRMADAAFSKGRLRAYVGGRRFAGDPRAIELSQHTDVVLEAGPPYVVPRPFTDWQGQ